MLVVSLVLACGGKSFEGEHGANGGEAGSASAGASNAGSSAGGTGSGGGGASNVGASGGVISSGGKATAGSSSGGNAGAASRCDTAAYVDELGGSVRVRLFNNTEKPLYLGPTMLGCNDAPPFEVTNASGQQLIRPPSCESTCEVTLQGGVVACPPGLCRIASVTVLQPGESTLTLWDGLYTDSVKLPPACQKLAGATTCDRTTSVKPGTYVFSAQAGSAFVCGVDSGCTLCTRDEQGDCIIRYGLAAGPFVQGKVVVALDGSYGIGGPGGVGMVREVQITFQ